MKIKNIILLAIIIVNILFFGYRYVTYKIAIAEIIKTTSEDDICGYSKIFVRPQKFKEAIINRGAIERVIDMDSEYYKQLQRIIQGSNDVIELSPYTSGLHRYYIGLPNITYLVDNYLMKTSPEIVSVMGYIDNSREYSHIEQDSYFIDIYTDLGLAFYKNKIFKFDIDTVSLAEIISKADIPLDQYTYIQENHSNLIIDPGWPCDIYERQVNREIMWYKLKNYGLWSLIYTDKHPIKEFTKPENYDSITFSSIEEFEASLK